MKDILEKLKNNMPIKRDEIIKLLSVDNFSHDFHVLCALSDMRSRLHFTRGYVFAQIGINAMECEGACKFCSMAKGHYCLETKFEKSVQEVVEQAESLIEKGIDDLFLMTTAGYDTEKLINIAREIKKSDGLRLVCNTGDFDYKTAKALKNGGFTGAYHVKRLREGLDTSLSIKKRIETIESIKNAGLELYYCIEPIGPEHTYDEIADEILFARDLKVEAMAVMRRTPVVGTPLYSGGMISKADFLKICAITRLVTNPSRSMNAHETTEATLMCGVNQLYAEMGSNPRDNLSQTSAGRGFSVDYVKNLLKEYNWESI